MKVTEREFLAVLVLAIVSVLSQWGFWEYGQTALGLNTVLCTAVIWYLLIYKNNAIVLKKDWSWLLPLWLITFSFVLFENPWLKSISLLVAPLATGFFFAFGNIDNKFTITWSTASIQSMVVRLFEPIQKLGASSEYCVSMFSRMIGGRGTLSNRVMKGIGILIPLALVVLGLLSSADAKFSLLTGKVFENIFSLLDLSTVMKICFIATTIIILLAILFSWRRELIPEIDSEEIEPVDDVVAGIVMVGVLILYVTFLYLQLEYLLVDRLPINFTEAERLVKSGFWQLFALSLINVILFFIVYKKTGYLTQLILRTYVIASGLIVLSACWRMWLYIQNYGFSYGKYFASYTCLFALLLFVYLVWASFSKTKLNIFRFVAFFALWFYALAAISPVEKIIFNTNMSLADKPQNRVQLDQLSHLSSDVLSSVQKLQLTDVRFQTKDWTRWSAQKVKEKCARQWYERNISLILNCSSKQ